MGTNAYFYNYIGTAHLHPLLYSERSAITFSLSMTIIFNVVKFFAYIDNLIVRKPFKNNIKVQLG